MRTIVMAMLAAAALAGGCARELAQFKSYAMNELPAELSGPVTAADQAIQELQQRLVARLSEEMARGGPMEAISVCRDEAQTITASVEQDRSIAVGRTSHRLRNPRNAPRAWTRSYVEAAAGKRAGQVEAVVVDLGDHVGVLKPIPTGAVCVTCHGATDAMAPELLAAIRSAYPEDHATEFAEGELRGFFWAEAKK